MQLLITNPQRILYKFHPHKPKQLKDIQEILCFLCEYSNLCGFSTTIPGCHIAGRLTEGKEKRLIAIMKDRTLLDIDTSFGDYQELYELSPELQEGKNEFLQPCPDPVTINLLNYEVATCKLFSRILKDHQSLTGEQLSDALLYKFNFFDRGKMRMCADNTTEDFYTIAKYSRNGVAGVTKDVRFFDALVDDLNYAPEDIRGKIQAWLDVQPAELDSGEQIKRLMSYQ